MTFKKLNFENGSSSLKNDAKAFELVVYFDRLSVWIWMLDG